MPDLNDQAVVVSETTPGSLLSAIVRMAGDPQLDVTKLTALLEMQERMETKAAEAEFNAALARLSQVMPRINRDGQVEYAVDKNKPDGAKKQAFRFATYENIDRLIRPHLQAEGMSLSFTTAPRAGEGGGVMVTGTLSHRNGHSRSASIGVALDSSGGKNNIQAMGSSFSYGKRYTTTMLLNIVTEAEDDDGRTGGMVFVTVEQQQQISKLLHETKAPLTAFLEFVGAESVESIQAKDFPKAINSLIKRAAQIAERKKAAEQAEKEPPP